MTKFIHCVFVQHEEHGKPFLFCLDDFNRLKPGDQVLCETIKGEVEGECVGKSFVVSESALLEIANAIGAYLPLKRVIGIIEEEYIKKKSIIRFEYGEENLLPF